MSEDGVHAVRTNASLEYQRAGVAVGFDYQWERAEGLRNSQGVVALAGLLVDEHRARGRKSSGVCKGLIGEEQALLVSDVEGP